MPENQPKRRSALNLDPSVRDELLKPRLDVEARVRGISVRDVTWQMLLETMVRLHVKEYGDGDAR